MSKVLDRLFASSDPVERETARTLRVWQDEKAAKGGNRRMGRMPGMINQRGCIATISATVRRESKGFGEVGPEDSFEAIVDKYPHRFELDVVQTARRRLFEAAKS
jgi:hypothetical protein